MVMHEISIGLNHLITEGQRHATTQLRCWQQLPLVGELQIAEACDGRMNPVVGMARFARKPVLTNQGSDWRC
jgi:hypothetical protein